MFFCCSLYSSRIAKIVDHRLDHLASQLEATLYGDPACTVVGAASLTHAQPGHITFIDNAKHIALLKETQASAVILSADLLPYCNTNALIVTQPRLAFAKLLATLYPPKTYTPGIHPTAIVGRNTHIDPSATILGHVTLGDDVKIEKNVVIHPGCYIGNGVEIQCGSILYSRVTLYDGVHIGHHAIIHSGVVIGSDGFGFEPHQDGTWIKIPQVGGVVIGDHVEIGANSAIDRGTLDNTVIGNGVKIDNHVMIAHNVQIGDHTIIAGCSGIAGSTMIGKRCIIGGDCAINGHISLTDGVILTGSAMVTHSLKEPGVYSSGTGILPRRKWQQCAVRFRQLDLMYKRLQTLINKNMEK